MVQEVLLECFLIKLLVTMAGDLLFWMLCIILDTNHWLKPYAQVKETDRDFYALTFVRRMFRRCRLDVADYEPPIRGKGKKKFFLI